MSPSCSVLILFFFGQLFCSHSTTRKFSHSEIKFIFGHPNWPLVTIVMWHYHFGVYYYFSCNTRRIPIQQKGQVRLYVHIYFLPLVLPSLFANFFAFLFPSSVTLDLVNGFKQLYVPLSLCVCVCVMSSYSTACASLRFNLLKYFMLSKLFYT